MPANTSLGRSAQAEIRDRVRTRDVVIQPTSARLQDPNPVEMTMETDRERAERHERERVESAERHERERREESDRYEKERKEDRERRERERRERKDAQA